MNEFMIDKRKALGLDIQTMAQRCRCSKNLLYMLEEGYDITHPEIAARIAKEYGLTVTEYNKIVHESHRAKRLPKPSTKKLLDKGLCIMYKNGVFNNNRNTKGS